MIPRTHDRYLLKQFLRILFFSVLSFTVIYVTVDIFEEIDNFIDHSASIWLVTKYYFFSIPFILTYILPVSLLLGTVFAMGVMGRRNETTALLASGVSLIRIASPIMITALLFSLGAAYFNDVVVAKANHKHKDIMRHDIEGRPRANPDIRDNVHYLGQNGMVYLAASYNHINHTLYDVVLQEFESNTVVRRIDARRATFRNNQWVFNQGFERTWKDTVLTTTEFNEKFMPELREAPGDFLKEEIDVENMTFTELREFIGKVERGGGDSQKYLVDLFFKFSFPFAGFIFVLIGVAFASGKRKQSVATGFGVTLLVSFLYYAVLRVGQTLGHNGVLPPLLAAQAGNLVFLTVGVYLLARANR